MIDSFSKLRNRDHKLALKLIMSLYSDYPVPEPPISEARERIEGSEMMGED